MKVFNKLVTMSDKSCPLQRPLIEAYKVPDRSRLQPLGRKFRCTYNNCSQVFYTLRAYDIHAELVHSCRHCGLCFEKIAGHQCSQIGGGASQAQTGFIPTNLHTGKFQLLQTQHRGTILVFVANFKNVILGSFSDVFEYLYADMETLLTELIEYYRGLKVSITISAWLENMKGENLKERRFMAPFTTFTNKAFIPGNLITAANYLITSLNLYAEGSSGFRLARIDYLEMRCLQYIPISPRGFLKTPIDLKRGTIFNIRTKSENCFILSILCALYRDRIKLPKTRKPVVNKFKQLKRLYENPKSYDSILQQIIKDKELNLNGFLGTVSLDQIDDFEKLNQISVSVFTNQGKNLIPARLPKIKCNKHVDLLILSSKQTDNDVPVTYHYTVIADVNRFLNRRNFHCRKFCIYCLKPTQSSTEDHEKYCQVFTEKKVTHPSERFYRFKKLEMVQDVAYKIFFSIQYFRTSCEKEKPALQDIKISCKLKHSQLAANLECAGISIAVINPKGELEYSTVYDGPNSMEYFFEVIFKIADCITKKIDASIIPLKPTKTDYVRYYSAKTCELCGLGFTKKRPACFQHDHMVPNIELRIWCSKCNIAARLRKMVFISHQFSKLDSHFILKALKPELVRQAKIVCKNSEQIISLVLNRNCRFLDSSAFLDATIEQLSHRLKDSSPDQSVNDVFPILNSEFGSVSGIELLVKKIPFPCDFFKNRKCFTLEGLPAKLEFYDSVLDSHISAQDYEHAKSIYEKYNCQTFQDYSRLYLKAITLLLSDIFMKFITYSQQHFGLSPAHCTSLAGFSYDCCMFSLKDKFEYIFDESIINFLSESIRGGPAFSVTRLARSNTERLGAANVKAEDRKEIIFCDLNSIYAYCLSQYQAISSYAWMTQEELDNIDFESLEEDTGTGFIFQVTLQYLPKYHSSHDMLPLAISKRKLRLEELSVQQQKLYKSLEGSISNPFLTEKLSMDLWDKPNYTVYYKALKFYLKHGLVVTKRHKGLKFKELPYFKEFISKLIELRKQARMNNDTIGEAMIKTMLVSIWGKQLTNTSAYTDVKVCLSRAEALSLIAKPTFQDFSSISEDVSLFQMSRRSVRYQYPLVSGWIVLDLAKIKLYEGWFMLQQTFSNCKLILGDTDSLAAICDDPNRDFIPKLRSLGQYFDFSNLQKDHELYDTTNKMIPGLWKLCSLNILEIISIRARNYSAKLFCSECGNIEQAKCSSCQKYTKGAGIPRVVLNRLSHDFYAQCLIDEGVKYVESKGIRAVNHKLGIYNLKRVGFHALNPARYLNENKVDSTAFGNIKLRSPSKMEEDNSEVNDGAPRV